MEFDEGFELLGSRLTSPSTPLLYCVKMSNMLRNSRYYFLLWGS
jgi:hypothetical protein